MRMVFHGELEQLGVELATMCGLAAETMERATRALLRCDLVLDERVISDDDVLDAARARCENHAFILLTLQAPVGARHAVGGDQHPGYGEDRTDG
ncbi:PhoU domain-containing protein [Pseudonocardia sichuanensis]|uniref:PhoU domain-containing protein n=1 Tax=Pseudonocardia kunmingensis TaxID=630975 RepID=UPI001FE7496F|nr:PhoU domain-containing protein [Pseudonocardia kunmingensis]